jgi:hypothetical protein
MQVCNYHRGYNRRNLPRNAIENQVIAIIFILYSRLQYAQTINVTIIILDCINHQKYDLIYSYVKNDSNSTG